MDYTFCASALKRAALSAALKSSIVLKFLSDPRTGMAAGGGLVVMVRRGREGPAGLTCMQSQSSPLLRRESRQARYLDQTRDQ
jgi:hypothetical protein